MTTVVIGADGFIGRHLTARLAADGVPDLVLVSRRRSDADLAALYPRARFVEGDLGDVEAMAEICRPAETVYQLAWGTTPHTSNADPVADLNTNAQAKLTEVEVKMDELLRLKAAREKTGTNVTNTGQTAAGPPKTKRQRLDDLLKLLIDDKINQTEYDTRWKTIVAEPD